MKIAFEKYHGTGNDFIMIDIRNHAIPDESDIIALLCDRRLGIGADGLIMLGNSPGHDFSMRYFNADGKESGMCGNGGRCITAFASKLGIIAKNALFIAPDGEHRASVISTNDKQSIISLEMKDVDAAKWEGNSIFLDTGSPHIVNLCKGLDLMDINTVGKKIRFDPRFGPQGTNVNFIENTDCCLKIRTYERGVEAETLSCGTGVTAAAIAWAIKQGIDNSVMVKARGGIMNVSFERTGENFYNIRLEGPAEFVFSGQTEI